MTGEGKVISAQGGIAVVRISKASACSHDCSECAGCSNPEYNMTVKNPLGAVAGDRVVIEADSSGVLLMAFVLYIIPVFFLIGAVVVADAVSGSILSILSAVIIVALLWIVLIKVFNKKMKLQNTIIRIIASE